MNDVLISGGTVISPEATMPGTDVLITDGVISQIGPGLAGELSGGRDVERVDATGCLVIPGLINAHSHGGTTGPLFSSAAAPLGRGEAVSNLDRHLADGVTTVVNVCGFGLPTDIPEHELDVRLGTTHLPSAVVAADAVDGAGLDDTHRAMSAEQMLQDGALLLGEIGSGATLGGGVAAYRYVPDALEPLLGRRIDPATATALIDSLVGLTRLAEPDDATLAQALDEAGLPASAHAAVREAILTYAVAPVLASLSSFAEAAELSAATGRPAVFHAAAPSVARLLELAQTTDARIIAGHMNHTSFTADEAVHWSRQLRAAGAILDVSSLDMVRARKLATPEIADALVKEGLVDTLSTDYAGGAWEPMLGVVQHWVDEGYIQIPEGIAMCTSTPADVLGLDDRGRIAVGLRGDVAVVSEADVCDVRTVIVEGRVHDFR